MSAGNVLAKIQDAPRSDPSPLSPVEIYLHSRITSGPIDRCEAEPHQSPPDGSSAPLPWCKAATVPGEDRVSDDKYDKGVPTSHTSDNADTSKVSSFKKEKKLSTCAEHMHSLHGAWDVP